MQQLGHVRCISMQGSAALRALAVVLLLCVVTSSRLPALNSLLSGEDGASQHTLTGAASSGQVSKGVHGSIRAPAGQQPGIELAARQKLFNYATQQGLQVLKTKVTELTIPDVKKSFNLPLVGDFSLQLYNIHVTQFNASSDEAKLEIMDEKFELWVTQVEATITFSWHWEKLGMTGTGTGELDLHGGNIDFRFTVVSQLDTGKPHIVVEDSSSKFSSVDLVIKSFSSDWLYQAVLALFNEQIQKAVSNGINNALQNDVPDALNKVLDTLPTHLEVKGLPFTTTFEYSIFTLSYVLVKGFGEVESGTPQPSAQQAQPGQSQHSSSKAGLTATPATSSRSSDHMGSSSSSSSRSSNTGSSDNKMGSSSSSSSMGSSDVAVGRPRRVMSPCPFAAQPLPLNSAQIASDSHMTSIYLHESVANCMLWGLFEGHALQYDLQDGTIAKLHLSTDLLAMLIPQLPKTYPHQSVRILTEATTMPLISFRSAQGTTLQASYRTTIFLANETLGNPKIVTMAANLTIQGQLGFDTTIIESAVVHHVVEAAYPEMPVNPAQWDNTVAWFIQNYAGLYPLQFIINNFVHTPVTSLITLVNAQSATYDGWFALSGDVQLHT